MQCRKLYEFLKIQFIYAFWKIESNRQNESETIEYLLKTMRRFYSKTDIKVIRTKGTCIKHHSKLFHLLMVL